MGTIHKKRLQMLRQVCSFLRGRPADPRVEPTLLALEAVIAQIEIFAETQKRTLVSRAHAPWRRWNWLASCAATSCARLSWWGAHTSVPVTPTRGRHVEPSPCHAPRTTRH